MFRELLNSINNSPSEDKPRSHLCLYLEFCGSFTSHQSLFIGRCYSFIVRWTIVQEGCQRMKINLWVITSDKQRRQQTLADLLLFPSFQPQLCSAVPFPNRLNWNFPNCFLSLSHFQILYGAFPWAPDGSRQYPENVPGNHTPCFGRD